MDLTGDVAGRILASAGCHRKSPLSGHPGLGWSPHHGLGSRVEGAALACLNAVLMVLCTAYSGLELSSGPLQVGPTRGIDVGVTSPWPAWFPEKRHSRGRECPFPAGFRGLLRAFPHLISKALELAESICLPDR